MSSSDLMTNQPGTRSSHSFGGTFPAELLQLSKPGITRLVTVAAGVGFAVCSAVHAMPLGGIVVAAAGCLLGTAIASAGANAFNQAIEVERDALMARTANRPLPAGRISKASARSFATVCSLIGPALIGLTTNWVAAAIAFATIALYVAVYTPMKPRSPWSTYIGAVPGALPCLIGWAAASPTPVADLAQGPAWSVFAILFFWQIPHFLAIAMMYRQQYERAGFRPVNPDATAGQIATQVLIWTMITIGGSALPLLAMPTLIGVTYAAVASIAGAVFIYASAQLLQTPTQSQARRVFFTSIGYLPITYLALVADALVGFG